MNIYEYLNKKLIKDYLKNEVKIILEMAIDVYCHFNYCEIGRNISAAIAAQDDIINVNIIEENISIVRNYLEEVECEYLMAYVYMIYGAIDIMD